jgi:hypothetical protein
LSTEASPGWQKNWLMTAHTQLVLWIAHPVLQLAVGAAMLRRKLHKTFPIFFSYICFQILSFCVLFPLNTWGSYETTYEIYFYLYWACSAISLVLGFMIIHEIFLDVFRPYHTLKDLGSVMFKWAALVMLLVAFVVAASNSGQRMEPILQAITTIQRCVLPLPGSFVAAAEFRYRAWPGRSGGGGTGNSRTVCRRPDIAGHGACFQSAGL